MTFDFIKLILPEILAMTIILTSFFRQGLNSTHLEELINQIPSYKKTDSPSDDQFRKLKQQINSFNSYKSTIIDGMIASFIAAICISLLGHNHINSTLLVIGAVFFIFLAASLFNLNDNKINPIVRLAAIIIPLILNLTSIVIKIQQF